MNKWEILALLKAKEPDYLSGTDISEKFEVTRTAIWKAIKELRTLGYEIAAKPQSGYKLLPSFDMLNAHELEYKFAKNNLPYKIIFLDTVDSTNNEAKRLQNPKSAKSVNANIVIAAAEQTGGRGRYNRSFSAKPNLGIYFTIKVNSSAEKLIPIENVTFYPLIAALSVCVAIKKLCGIELKIKWPNDLLYDEKKICGILTEASIEAESREVAYVIVGIGVNINNNIEDFPDELRDKATSLKIISGKKYDRADIICEIVGNFTSLSSLPRSEMLREYRKYLITGRKISFMYNNIECTGTIQDINDSGNLIVLCSDGDFMTIQSGEINIINF